MNNRRNPSPFNIGSTLVSLLLFAVIAIGLFWLAGQIYRLLLYIAPLFIIAAALIDYRVIIGYVRTLGSWLKHRTLLGVVAVLFTIIGYPIVFAFLLIKAILSRRVRKARKEGKKRQLGEYIEYEEMEEEVFELPEIEERDQRDK